MARIPCAFSVQEDFLEVIDKRAKQLGMKRSDFIVQALRKELFLNTSGSMSIVAEQSGVGNSQTITNFSSGSTTGPALAKKPATKKSK